MVGQVTKGHFENFGFDSESECHILPFSAKCTENIKKKKKNHHIMAHRENLKAIKKKKKKVSLIIFDHR